MFLTGSSHSACRQPFRSSSRPQARTRHWTVTCSARGDSPYEPLEKAIRVINRVIALGERTKWGTGEEEGSGSGGGPPSSQQQQQRWVQFGAVYNSRLSVEQPVAAAGVGDVQAAAAAGQQQVAADGSASSGASFSGRQLRDYLALPIEEYSLLDPKWISREEGGLFRFCLPLQDLVNVDLQPEIYFSVLTEPQQRRVTVAGTRAALGSPELDQAFKLNVSGVISERQPRRLPMPDHLPGRPVYRLRRWAAAARGRTWPPEGNGAAAAAVAGTQQGQRGTSSSNGAAATASVSAAGVGAEVAQAGAAAVAAAAAAAAEAAPFPSQHVYISHDDDENDEDVGPAELAAAAEVADVALAELELQDQAQHLASSSSSGMPADVAGAATGLQQQQQQQQQAAQFNSSSTGTGKSGQQALLHCRAHVTMAVRVPGALKVVPNALLGYAGSLLLRAILTATLPNFLELLAADYRHWAGLAGTNGGKGGRQLDAPVGELFSDAAAAVREGRERRQQLQEAEGGGKPEQQPQEREKVA